MLTIAASAQITWNAKGGFGVATCYGWSSEYVEDAEMSKKAHLVGKVGVGIEYPLTSNWSLMPSLELAWKGAKYEFEEKGWVDKSTLDFTYVQVPIVAAYRMNLTDAWNLTLKAGPYFAYAISDKFTVEYEYTGDSSFPGSSGSESGSADIKKFDAGLDVGVDFEHHRFVFGVEAELGFMELESYAKAKNLAFYATLGWKF